MPQRSRKSGRVSNGIGGPMAGASNGLRIQSKSCTSGAVAPGGMDSSSNFGSLAPGAALADGRGEGPDAAARASDEAQAGFGGVAEDDALGARLAGFREGVPDDLVGEYRRHRQESFGVRSEPSD